MQEQTANVNLNSAECTKSSASFGYTIYTNICTGTSQRVEWGNLDWVGAIGLGVGVTCLCALLLMVLSSIAKDFWD